MVMRKRRAGTLAGSVLLALMATGTAGADLDHGQPIITPGDNMAVTIEFRGSSAGANGQFYFLGTGDSTTVLDWADDSNSRDLGQFLFDNHTSIKGSVITLDGVFQQGDVLHFAYDIPKTSKYHDLFRTDRAGDADHFAFDLDTGDLGIEDLRPGNASYDGDYNDAMFRVTFSPSVPVPATLGVLGIAGLWLTRRRRLARGDAADYAGYVGFSDPGGAG